MRSLSKWFLGVTAALGCQVALADEPAKLPGPPAAPAANAAAPEVPGLAPACGDHGCGCGHGGVIGGVGLYLIQPYFESNPAYTITSEANFGNNNIGTRSQTVDVSHNMDLAPEAWLGYISDCGLGMRARWWYFRQHSDQALDVPQSVQGATDGVAIFSATPLGLGIAGSNAGAPISFSTTSKLQLQVWDVEAIQDVQLGRLNLLFAGGVRLAHINQQYNAFFTGDPFFGPVGSASLVSSHSFHGVGPELALDARLPIRDGGFALFGSMRGAVLFGSAKQNATVSFVDASNGDTLTLAANDHRDRVLPVGELELGMEYGRNVRNSRMFGQVALVGQEWWGAGNASRSNGGGLVFPPSEVPAGNSSVDSDIGFFGVAFRLGINY